MSARASQAGFVLFIALIVLVIMSLTAVGLVRAVDSGALAAGNLAFKKGATAAGDRGIEAARNFLVGGAASAALHADAAAGARGYWATWQVGADLFAENDMLPDYDWGTSSTCVGNASLNGITNCARDSEGNRMAWVIHRLCDSPGNPATVNCVRPPAQTVNGGGRGGVSYGSMALTVATQSVYRVTVRIEGPRDTLSFVQATIY